MVLPLTLTANPTYGAVATLEELTLIAEANTRPPSAYRCEIAEGKPLS